MIFVLSGNLLRFTKFRNQIEVSEPTLNQCLQGLVRECPELQPVLMDGEGKFRRVHRLFLNGNQLKAEELSREVGPKDECTILTALAGG